MVHTNLLKGWGNALLVIPPTQRPCEKSNTTNFSWWFFKFNLGHGPPLRVFHPSPTRWMKNNVLLRAP